MKKDSRIKHHFVKVFRIDFLRGKTKCKDGVERSIVIYPMWQMGGYHFIPLFGFYLAPRFSINGKKLSGNESFCYFSARFIWWQINATFWYSK